MVVSLGAGTVLGLIMRRNLGHGDCAPLGELSTDRCDICKVQGTKLFLHGRKDAVNKHPASSSIGVSIEHRVQSRTSSSPFAVVSLVKRD
jgi:hypothetical protein